MVQIHQQINVFAKLGFRHDFMLIWGFILEHFGHILGFKSASKSIPELDIHHGGPMGASGWPLGTSGGRRGIKVSILGHFALGMRILGVPGGKHPWALRAWDEDFGGPYMSFGQSIISHSLVAP